MRVAVIGGGFAGAYAIHSIQHASRDARITLFEPRSRFVFTPLLHEVAAGVLDPDAVTHAYADMFRHRITHVRELATRVDLAGKRVIAHDGSEHPFDYVVIAPGSRSSAAPGGAHVHTLKSVEDAVAIKEALERNVAQAKARIAQGEDAQGLLRCVIVGGGPTGVELAAELNGFLAYLLRKAGIAQQGEIVLVHSHAQLLPHEDGRLREIARKRLERKGVSVLTEARVERVGDEGLVARAQGEERTIPASCIVWAAGIVANGIEVTGVEKVAGRIPVERTLQVKGCPFAFAIGDASRVVEEPLPDLAQVATREGAHAGKNIARLSSGHDPHPFAYRSQGFLVSLGQGYGAGRIGKALVRGPLAWVMWRTVYVAKFLGARSKARIAKEYTLRLFRRDA